MLIGIAGKTGSGKSELSRNLNKEYNYCLIDVDKVVHDLIENSDLKSYIKKIYPCCIENDRVDRRVLANYLFQNDEVLDRYNKVVWFYLEEELDRVISKSENVILDWALLPISKYYENSDINILVTCSDCEREKRILKRDKINDKEYNLRNKVGLDYDIYQFDYVYDNSKGEILDGVKNIRKCINLWSGNN